MVMPMMLPAKRIPNGTLVKVTQAYVDVNVLKGDLGELVRWRDPQPRGRKAPEQFKIVFDDGTELKILPDTQLRVVGLSEKAKEARKAKQEEGKVRRRATWQKVKQVAKREAEGFKKFGKLVAPSAAGGTPRKGLPSVRLGDRASRERFLDAWHEQSPRDFMQYYDEYDGDGRMMIQTYLADRGLPSGDSEDSAW